MKSRAKPVWVVLGISLSVLVGLALAEMTIPIFSGFFKDQKLDFEDAFRKEPGFNKGGSLKPNFREFLRDGYGGTVLWINNGDGFRSRVEYSQVPKEGVLRIMSMGDSFTAGYRVGQEDTFSFLLEKWLNLDKHIPAEVLVVHEGGGGCPVSGLYYLETYGKDFLPDILLLGITLGNDIAQAYVGLHQNGPWNLHLSSSDFFVTPKTDNSERIGFLHGLENLELPEQSRSRQNKSKGQAWASTLQIESLARRVVFRDKFFYEPDSVKSFYMSFKHSGTKLFDPTHGLGVYLKHQPPEVCDAYEALFTILRAFRNFCASRQITFVVALFPQRFQVQRGDWEKTVQRYGLNEAAFDLNLPNDLIKGFCTKESIYCIDPTLTMTERHVNWRASLYLPQADMHWNKLGHAAWLEGAKAELENIVDLRLNEKDN